MAQEAAEDFKSSLNDLTFNSKPLINMLTMLAEENVQYASQIVQVIEAHIHKARPPEKLPCLYLIDSIVKNVKVENYIQALSQNIVGTFCNVFEKVDEKTRQAMFKMRQTWNDIFPAKKLYALDVRVNNIDPAWPISALPELAKSGSSIHVNPKFIVKTPIEESTSATTLDFDETAMRKQLIAKQQELLKLQQQQLELELAETKAKLEKQQQELEYKDKLIKEQEKKPSIADVPLEKLNIRDPRLAKRFATMPKEKPEPDSSVAILGIPVSGLADVNPMEVTGKKDATAIKSPSKKDPRQSTEQNKLGISKKEAKSERETKDPPKDGQNKKGLVKGGKKSHNREDKNSSTDSDRRNPRQRYNKEHYRNNRRPNTGISEKQSSRRHENSLSKDTGKDKDSSSNRQKRNYRSHRDQSESPDHTKVLHETEIKRSRSRSQSPKSAKSSKTSPRRSRSKLTENKLGNFKEKNGRLRHKESPTSENEQRISSDSKGRRNNDDTERDGNNRHKGGKRTVHCTIKQEDQDERRGHHHSPPVKRGRLDNRQESDWGKMDDDLSDLFGSEDQDYRQHPPKENILQPRSPWAKFKEKHRDDFPFPQPSQARGNMPLLRIPRRQPERKLSQDDASQVLLIDQQEEILLQAEKRLTSGALNPAQHQELLSQLAELYKVQQIRTQLQNQKAPIELNDKEKQQHQTKLKSSEEAYREHLRKLKRTVVPNRKLHQNLDKSMMPPTNRRPNRENLHPPSFPVHAGPKFGPQQFHRPIGPVSMMRPFPGGLQQRMPLRMHPNKINAPIRHESGFVKPFEDPRLAMILQSGPKRSCEIVIDDFAFQLTPGMGPRRIRIGGRMKVVSADVQTREILIDRRCYYRMGDPIRDVVIHGKSHRIYFHGVMHNVWIDGLQYNIRFDAPPQRIVVSDQSHEVSVNSAEGEIYIDGECVGLWGGHPRQLLLGQRKHEIRFEPPPREILIDGKLCQLNFEYVIPIVMIEGKPHGIRFDGPPRPMTIDGIDFMVPMDEPSRAKVGKRPYEVAFGGPGYEVVIGGECYEVQFDAPPRDVWIGGRMRRLQLKGPPPDVKILDEISPEDMNHLIAIKARRTRQEPHEFQQRHLSLEHRMDTKGQKFIRDDFNKPVKRFGAVLPDNVAPQPSLLAMSPSEKQDMSIQPSSSKIDVNDLFSKLLFAGIISQTPEPDEKVDALSEKDTKEQEEENTESGLPVIPVQEIDNVPDMTDLDTTRMKERFNGVLQRLYNGIQCCSCGVRFIQDQSEEYREHLDWHFRQNKREKEDTNVAKYRKWFYNIQDWIMYVEIEEGGDAFDGYSGEVPSDPGLGNVSVADVEGAEIDPVATGENAHDVCDVCAEPFDLVWNNEKEEWHLQDAVRLVGKTYHLVCYDDAREGMMDTSGSIGDSSMFPIQSGASGTTGIPGLEQSELEQIVKTEEKSTDIDPQKADKTARTETDSAASSSVHISTRVEPFILQQDISLENEQQIDDNEIETVKTEQKSADTDLQEAVKNAHTKTDSAAISTPSIQQGINVEHEQQIDFTSDEVNFAKEPGLIIQTPLQDPNAAATLLASNTELAPNQTAENETDQSECKSADYSDPGTPVQDEISDSH